MEFFSKLLWGKKWPCRLLSFICKHVVGMAIRLNYCKPPPAAKYVKVGEKRRAGRPAKI